MPPIAEHMAALSAQGYTIYKHSTTHPHIAYATSREGAFVLKCVRYARVHEIEMLRSLHQASASNNHTISFNVILSTQRNTVIAMPLKEPLSDYNTFSAALAAVFSRQLLEAVQFLHAQGVAHRDLKPANVVVDRNGRKLFIIDYDLARFVKGRHEVVCGFVGTDGFTAPEVRDETYYSPIAADIWAAGSLLTFLLARCDDPSSPKLKPIQRISRLLLNHDPAQRPGADEALAMLTRDKTAAVTHQVPSQLVNGSAKRTDSSSHFLGSPHSGRLADDGIGLVPAQRW